LSNKVIPKQTLARVAKIDLGGLGGAPRSARPQAEARAAPAGKEAALKRAREQGYQEGLAAGRQEAQSAAAVERAELKALISSVNELLKDFEQGLANDVLSISLELSKLIVRTSLRVKPELIIAVVREAVSSLPGLSEQTLLYLHPADAALLREIAANDAQLNELSWKIVEDPQLERGGCRLAAATTEADATLETRWRRVIASLGRDDAWIDITI
jgi:flagellar assembly protein FliH